MLLGIFLISNDNLICQFAHRCEIKCKHKAQYIQTKQSTRINQLGYIHTKDELTCLSKKKNGAVIREIMHKQASIVCTKQLVHQKCAILNSIRACYTFTAALKHFFDSTYFVENDRPAHSTLITIHYVLQCACNQDNNEYIMQFFLFVFIDIFLSSPSNIAAYHWQNSVA